MYGQDGVDFESFPKAHVRIESLASDRGPAKFRVNARNEMGSSAFSESSTVIVTYQAIDVVDTTSTNIEYLGVTDIAPVPMWIVLRCKFAVVF